jgi:hypothetical protein
MAHADMLTTQLEKDGAKYPRPPSANFLEEDLPAERWRRAAAATEEDRKITVSGLTLDF